MPDFTDDELDLLTELIWSDMSSYHETLADEETTMASAIARFDREPAATALKKIAPDSHTALQERITSKLAGKFAD